MHAAKKAADRHSAVMAIFLFWILLGWARKGAIAAAHGGCMCGRVGQSRCPLKCITRFSGFKHKSEILDVIEEGHPISHRI